MSGVASMGRIENKIKGLETRLAELNGEQSTPLDYVRREVDLLRDDVRILDEKLNKVLALLEGKASVVEPE